MKVSIVGHGIAGLMLGEELLSHGRQVVIYGKGCSQAPPQVIVHLHAGRSFRRSDLERLAFKKAVSYWRQSPFATEVKVKRDTNPRLEKSFTLTENDEWDSPLFDSKSYTYGPAFIVMADKLRQHLLGLLDFREFAVPTPLSVEEETLFEDSDQVVFAQGFKSRLSYCSLNKGVSIFKEKRKSSANENRIRIGKGIHYATTAEGCSLGGAFLNSDNPRERLFEKTQHLIEAQEWENFKKEEMFSGQKLVSQDRLPVVGFDSANTFYFTAFGARAFFWLPFSTQLAHKLLTKPTTQNAFSPLRFRSN